MIKKYLWDAVSIVSILLLTLLLSGKPSVDFNPPPAASAEVDQKVAEEKPRETKAAQTIAAPLYAALEKRNIFVEIGAYATAEKALLVLPANPYMLVAVLQGNDKKAIFREYTGAIITVPVGKKMIDEYVLESIEGVTVKLKRGQERKKLTVFNPGSAPAVMSPDDLKKHPTPYKLIGILNGKEKKAVLKDYTNATIILAVGEKLGNGSVVTAIGDVSVQLKKGKEKTELKIFGNHMP